MRVITKIKMFGTLAALIGAFAAFQIATGGVVRDRRDNQFLLSAQWKPGVLSIQNTVHITVLVDGYPLHRYNQHVSPWSKTLTAEDGAVVALTVSTSHPSVFLMDCIILKNGATVPRTGYDSSPGPGSVRCEAT